MKSEDWNKLLEQGLSGGRPRPEFREEVLADSAVAFVHGRRSRARQRAGLLWAAAVLIAAVSFFLGRYSLRKPAPGTVPVGTPVAAESQGVAVPNDLVAWLDAARLFHQLGMPDRMGHAVDRASRLLPADTPTATVACGTDAPGRGIEKIALDGGGITAISDSTGRTADARFPILSALALPTTPLPLRPSPPGSCPSSAENVSPITAESLGD